MRIILFTLFAFGLSVMACKGSETLITEGSCDDCRDAVIRDFGDPALDGCGFVVDVDSKIYMPKNLPEAYQVDAMKVALTYQVQDSTRCGMVQFYPAITIQEIRKRQ
ncbi:MAG: hypothetical protein AAF466_13415 [Bacteroidota bacterium]